MPIIDENTGFQKFKWPEEDLDEIEALNESDRSPQDNADAACLKKMEGLPDPNAFLNDDEIAQIKRHARSDGRFTWERIESWKRGEDDFRGWNRYEDNFRETLRKMSDYGWTYNGKIYSMLIRLTAPEIPDILGTWKRSASPRRSLSFRSSSRTTTLAPNTWKPCVGQRASSAHTAAKRVTRGA
jgi:hypothetical protein